MAFILNTTPNWQKAVEELIDQMQLYPDVETRIQLLEHLGMRLGDDCYPALLQLLCLIDKHADSPARSMMGETMAHGLSTGRLPSGKLNAWGASHLISDNPFLSPRSIGPVECLCAWHTQEAFDLPLETTEFVEALASLLDLFTGNNVARNLYRQALGSITEGQHSDVLSRETCRGLQALASAWEEDSDTRELAQLYLENAVSNHFLLDGQNRLDSLDHLII